MDWRKIKRARHVRTGIVYKLIVITRANDRGWHIGDVLIENLRDRLQLANGDLTRNGEFNFIPVSEKKYPKRSV